MRKLYQKGWYYEREAKKIIYKKYFDDKHIVFIIKAPYSYPFDILLIDFCCRKISLWEIKFTYHNYVIINPKKINKVNSFIKGYENIKFEYYVLVFFGGKYNYQIFPIDLHQKGKIILKKS